MPDRQYWLVKSEPDVFSFDDLVASPKKTTSWDGVRNYAARNHMRAMQKGDLVFFYHSNGKPPAIVGVAEVAKEAYPDSSAFDAKDSHFDPKSKADNPTWYMVDLKAVAPLARPVTLDEIKKTKSLETMALVRISQLSVQPVSPAEYATIEKLSQKKG
ncbi:MAG TPA: EVE domain-containing protein [Gemmatimonadaceae bacterium]|jgi:predicted RNA-binding protein with PUA-like domain